MRHREFLIATHNATTLSLHGMAVVPWRRGKRYSVKPAGILEPHPVTGGGDSGNKPEGFISKNKRVKAGPPGSPSGRCLKGTGLADTCRCGGHYRR